MGVEAPTISQRPVNENFPRKRSKTMKPKSLLATATFTANTADKFMTAFCPVLV